jgi:hypothetical protein
MACSAANALDVFAGDKNGSIVLDKAGRQKVYENIIGDDYDVRRSLSTINGSPAIVVLDRDFQYLTLAVEHDQIVIDCTYSDTRNNYNGARVTAGVCGLHWPLDETYRDVARQYSNHIQESIFSFDTQALVYGSMPSSFLLGNIDDIEVYDRYLSVMALANASPKKYIKGPYGCFDFDTAVGFLVFLDKDSPELKFLDVLESQEPMILKRMSYRDLIKLAVDECQ